jgi:hypothetical protein
MYPMKSNKGREGSHGKHWRERQEEMRKPHLVPLVLSTNMHPLVRWSFLHVFSLGSQSLENSDINPGREINQLK